MLPKDTNDDFDSYVLLSLICTHLFLVAISAVFGWSRKAYFSPLGARQMTIFGSVALDSLQRCFHSPFVSDE